MNHRFDNAALESILQHHPYHSGHQHHLRLLNQHLLSPPSALPYSFLPYRMPIDIDVFTSFMQKVMDNGCYHPDMPFNMEQQGVIDKSNMKDEQLLAL